MRHGFTAVSMLLAVVTTASVASAAPAAPLTMDGLGPLRFGMTVRQIEKAIGPLDISYDAGGPDCGEGRPKAPWIPGFSFMVVKGRLARIDLSAPRGIPPSRITTKTEAGVGIGSRIADVKKAYGRRLTVEPRPYDEEDNDLVVEDAKRGRKFIFETAHGRIDTFRSGVTGAVDAIEGCA